MPDTTAVDPDFRRKQLDAVGGEIPPIRTAPEKLWNPKAPAPGVRHEAETPPPLVPAEQRIEVTLARMAATLEQQLSEALTQIQTASTSAIGEMREQMKNAQEWFDHTRDARNLDLDEVGSKVDLSVEKMRKVLESVEKQELQMTTKTVRAWCRAHRVQAVIPERIDQIDQHRKKPGRAVRSDDALCRPTTAGRGRRSAGGPLRRCLPPALCNPGLDPNGAAPVIATVSATVSLRRSPLSGASKY